jgi:hypothetical protein
MSEKYIRNEDFNFIHKQVALIKDSCKKNAAPNVIQAVKDLAYTKILEHFPDATLDQKHMLDLTRFKTDQEYDRYLQNLTDYLLPFAKIVEQQLKKMFPKNKKLKLPNLDNMSLHQLTYLSWLDISSNKKFIVYELENKMVGIECKYTPISKDNICSFCNHFGQVAYISTITKAKKAKNPDYYKAIGNYICIDSTECNKKITSTDYLTAFLRESLGEKTDQ